MSGKVRGQVRYKLQCEIDINKAVVQLFCPVPAIRADLFEFPHVAFCRGVDLFDGIRLKILILQDEVLHHNRIQEQRFKAAQYVGVFTGKEGPYLWKSRKDNGNAASMIRFK